MLDLLNIILSLSLTNTSTQRIFVNRSARLSSERTYFGVMMDLSRSVCTQSCLTSICLSFDLKAEFSVKAMATLLSIIQTSLP